LAVTRQRRTGDIAARPVVMEYKHGVAIILRVSDSKQTVTVTATATTTTTW